tara:strand:- start:178 stop:597 length:420 start_codon:yes stop_codon:yes gene_type:complete
MCGFICFVNEDTLSNQYYSLIKTGKIPIHRGPDSQKFYRSQQFAAYFKRLSIVDLSQKSNQPLISQNKRYVMAFNGEIYNFKEKNKITSKKIIEKSKSLRGVLEPFSDNGNLGYLKRAGFSDVQTIFQHLCFKGYLCIK